MLKRDECKRWSVKNGHAEKDSDRKRSGCCGKFVGWCIAEHKPDFGQVEYDETHGLTASEDPKNGNSVETGTEEAV